MPLATDVAVVAETERRRRFLLQCVCGVDGRGDLASTGCYRVPVYKQPYGGLYF